MLSGAFSLPVFGKEGKAGIQISPSKADGVYYLAVFLEIIL